MRQCDRGRRTALWLREEGVAAASAPVEAFLAEVPVLPFDVSADSAYGDIRAELEAAGLLIRSNDLLIAAHARALAATMVTANVAEFRRVSALNVENWLE